MRDHANAQPSPPDGTRPDDPDDSVPIVDVGVLAAPGPQRDTEQLRNFTEQIVETAESELTDASETSWRFHPIEVDPLPDGRGRRPAAFIDDAMVRIAERPYDVFVVVTDVPLTSHRKRAVPGLASLISRTVVISTRRLVLGTRGTGPRPMDAPAVRWNGARLLLHLIGHILGADHTTGDGIMNPFRFDSDRRSVPSFESVDTRNLQRLITQIPDESVSRGRFGQFVFHLRSLAHNPGDVVRAVRGSRGVLLPLSLPKLATAAVTPAFILVFSAETWDVGLHLGNEVALLFAMLSVLVARIHLLSVQNLYFPRESGQTVSENMALVNVTVFFVLLTGIVGLFLLVGTVVLCIEMFVFPPDLMTNWPSLEDPAVDTVDLLRTAMFISTLGVLSGALAGGVEERSLIGHLALFQDEP